MGFSGGGANVTKAHTHSSAIVQDGGSLNFSNVTQAGMAAGDITYSDGNALQILNVGNATETLQVNGAATAPEWAAAGGGASVELVGSTTLGADTASITITTAAISFADISKITCEYQGITTAFPYPDLHLEINGLNAANYDTEFLQIQAGSLGGSQLTSGTSIVIVGGASRGRMVSGEFNIWCDTPTQAAAGSDTLIKYAGKQTSHPSCTWSYGGMYNDAGGATYTSFTEFSITASSGNLGEGFKLSVYKHNS